MRSHNTHLAFLCLSVFACEADSVVTDPGGNGGSTPASAEVSGGQAGLGGRTGQGGAAIETAGASAEGGSAGELAGAEPPEMVGSSPQGPQTAMALTGTPGTTPPGACAPAPPLKPKPPPDVAFSPERGWYSGDQMLTLTPKTPGASLSYAVGGGLPDQPYEGPIAVNDNGSTVTVRARATTNGVPGPLQTHTFVFRPDVGGAVVLMTDNDLTAAPDKTERTVTFEFIPSPQSCLVPVAEEAGTAPNAGGSSAGASDKVYFRRAYGNGTLDGDLFGDHFYGVRPTLHHDHLYLRADHTDRSFMRNIIAHDAHLSLGQLGMHGRFVDFFDNGKLKGTRYLHERPEGGFMESYTDVDKKQWLAVSGVDAMMTYLDQRVTLYAAWEEVIESIDVRSLVDFMLVQWQAGVSDFQPERRNWRATGPVGPGGGPDSPHRWHFFNWDIDRGYRFDELDLRSPMHLWDRIQQFPQARFTFQDRLQCAFLNGGPLTVPRMMERFNARLAQLQTTSLLTESGKDLSRDPMLLAASIEPWLVAREQLLFEGAFTPDTLPQKQALVASVSADAVLTLTSPTEQWPMYYRLDGGDPRTLGGELDPLAVLYTAPVALPSGRIEVIARSFDEAAVNPFERFSPACDEPQTFVVTGAQP